MNNCLTYTASLNQIFDMLLITTSVGASRSDLSPEEANRLSAELRSSFDNIQNVVEAAASTKTAKEHRLMSIPIGIAWLTALREAERNLLKSEIIRKVANELAAADLSVRPSPSNN